MNRVHLRSLTDNHARLAGSYVAFMRRGFLGRLRWLFLGR